MKQATCQWCNSIVQAPDDYDRKKHKMYCSQDCLEKEWLFMQWQSDRILNMVREYNYGKTKSESDQSSNQKPEGET